jgi:hypothetical protein
LDDRRTKFRGGLSGLYLPVYDKLCSLLGPEWQPFYGLRTFAEQDLLYSHGRTTPGSIVTNAKGGQSPHNYGCASDWTLWDANGQPIWMPSHDTRWAPYITAIREAKGRPGADFHLVDYPHNELPISLSWEAVGLTPLENAQDFIKAHMV